MSPPTNLLLSVRQVLMNVRIAVAPALKVSTDLDVLLVVGVGDVAALGLVAAAGLVRLPALLRLLVRKLAHRRRLQGRKD